MRVAFPAERAIELFFFVRFAIAVGVFEQPDIGNGPGDALPRRVRADPPLAPPRRGTYSARSGRAPLPGGVGGGFPRPKRIEANRNIQPIGKRRYLLRA